MILLLFSIIVFSSCNNKASFDNISASGTIHSFIDDVIFVEGMDIKIDGEYLARIGSKNAEVRIINEFGLEVKVPDNAENGELRIVEGNKESIIGEIQMNKLYLVNNTGRELAEHAIGSGRFIKTIATFEDFKIVDMVYSENTNEIILCLQNNLQFNEYQLYKYNIDDESESRFNFNGHYKITIDEEGNLYGINLLMKINKLSLVDGAILEEIANLDHGASTFQYLPSKNVIRSYFIEVIDGLEYHNFTDLDINTKTTQTTDQEFQFIDVVESKDNSLFAFIPYMGIVESSYSGEINDYILENDQYASYFDFLEERDMIVATMNIKQDDGSNPSFIVTRNTETNVENHFQISPYEEVLIASIK